MSGEYRVGLVIQGEKEHRRRAGLTLEELAHDVKRTSAVLSAAHNARAEANERF